MMWPCAGALDFTYVDSDMRLCRGDKANLFCVRLFHVNMPLKLCYPTHSTSFCLPPSWDVIQLTKVDDSRGK